MRKIAFFAAAALAAVPAGATTLMPSDSGLTFSAMPAGTQGMQIAYDEQAQTALTFAAIFRSAVYRNALGTLDFYYQVQRTGPGSLKNQEIKIFTASSFARFDVDA
ncbi:MAG TPA: PEP-CTERM sorting domain-containing protein, partial [Sphingomonas sp.]|nr:PEP-CTERM sorting domain-containing protein [Sphingomonas sp.]